MNLVHLGPEARQIRVTKLEKFSLESDCGDQRERRAERRQRERKGDEAFE